MLIYETRSPARCPTRVIRRHVLAAVDAGVAAGDDDVARAALRRVDWILRGQARRWLEQALIDAALATGVLATDAPAAARHVLRAAAGVAMIAVHPRLAEWLPRALYRVVATWMREN